MADLETDVPETPPTPEPTQPTTLPATPLADGDEPTTIEVEGQKMVPITALHAERERAKTFKDKAQQFDQTVGYLQAVRPQLEYLQQHPEVMAGTPAPTTPAPAADPELVELATTLDLYTREGKPDTERAAKLAQYTRNQAQAAMQPLHDATAQTKAVENFHRMSQLKTADGRPINQEALRQVWQATPAAMLADPNIAYVYASAILGHELLQAPAAPVPGMPPLVTEAPGSRTMERTPPTDLQQKIMALRGIDSKKYAELTKNFKPGNTNIIEDPD